MRLGGFFDYEQKKEKLAELNRELELPETWQKQERTKELNLEASKITNQLRNIEQVAKYYDSTKELLELCEVELDSELYIDIQNDIGELENKIEQLELLRMFSHKLDSNNAYLSIQSGSGGTEAQDWAEMLLRMYLLWFEKKNFKVEINDLQKGEVAGIKNATVHIKGDFSYGWAKTEAGIHRLVRKSPFDSNSKRHTSFASVFISPEIDEDELEIELIPADIRVDVYRASGAGGQHVNKTESAVRLTHLPTNTVVQCQNGRSQHQNKNEAMKQLRSKLYELKLNELNSKKQELESNKPDIGWGNQIRSYVLDSSRIKDLRTSIETRNTQAVLDGNLDLFVVEALKQQVA